MRVYKRDTTQHDEVWDGGPFILVKCDGTFGVFLSVVVSRRNLVRRQCTHTDGRADERADGRTRFGAVHRQQSDDVGSPNKRIGHGRRLLKNRRPTRVRRLGSGRHTIVPSPHLPLGFVIAILIVRPALRLTGTVPGCVYLPACEATS